MSTSRQQIKFGEAFTVSVNNVRQEEFEVLNFHDQDFDTLLCKITNSTSYVPPAAYVTDEINSIIKLVFDSRTPINAGLELLLQGGVSTKEVIVEKKYLIDGQAVKEGAKTAVSSSYSMVKTMIIGFLAVSFIFWGIKGTSFGDLVIDIWSKFNAAQVIQMADQLDPRIISNKHQIYQSAHFTAANSIFKEEFGDEAELSKLYTFAGNDIFVMSDLAQDKAGMTLFVTHREAVNLCDVRFGRLMTKKELKAYLAREYLTVENPFWPINLRSQIAEWSVEDYSFFSDDYWLYIKSSNHLIVSGLDTDNIRYNEDKTFILADDGKVTAAFRCAFDGHIYKVVE